MCVIESVVQATTNVLLPSCIPLDLQRIAYTREKTGAMRKRNALFNAIPKDANARSSMFSVVLYVRILSSPLMSLFSLTTTRKAAVKSDGKKTCHITCVTLSGAGASSSFRPLCLYLHLACILKDDGNCIHHVILR